MRFAPLAAGLLACAAAACASRERRSGPERDDDDDGDERELDVRDAARDARVTLADAIRAALTAKPGAAMEAELEGEVADGRREVEFEVAIVDAEGVVWDVSVDAATGRVVEVEREDDEDDLREILATRRAVGTPRFSLAELTEKAALTGEGMAVEAEFDADRPAEAEVIFLRGRDVTRVTMDMRTGGVLQTRRK